MLQSSIYERHPQFMQSIWYSKVCLYPTLSSTIVKLKFSPLSFALVIFDSLCAKKKLWLNYPVSQIISWTTINLMLYFENTETEMESPYHLKRQRKEVKHGIYHYITLSYNELLLYITKSITKNNVSYYNTRNQIFLKESNCFISLNWCLPLGAQ